MPPVVQERPQGWSKEALLALLALLVMILLPVIRCIVRKHWSLVKEFYRTKFGREADNGELLRSQREFFKADVWCPADGAHDPDESVLLVPLIFERGVEEDQLDAITTGD